MLRRVAFLIVASCLGLAACVSPHTGGTAHRAAEMPGAARLEVTRALYESAATYRARIVVWEAGLEALRADIRKLQERGTEARAELAAAQERFMAELADWDPLYADHLAALRGALEDIASTPEGLKALILYNRGDRREAVARLDELRAAFEREHATRTDAERAAAARPIAVLVADAPGGAFTVEEALARYRQLTRLDPNVHRNWLELSRLYQATDERDGIVRAAEQALRSADNDRERLDALTQLGIGHAMAAEYDRSLAAYSDALAVARRLNRARPDSARAPRDVARCLIEIGHLVGARADRKEAETAYREAFELFRRLMVSRPASAALRQEVWTTLSLIAFEQAMQGDREGSAATDREAVRIFRHLARDHPALPGVRRDLAMLLILHAESTEHQDREGEFTTHREVLEIFRRLAKAHPASAIDQANLARALDRAGDLLEKRGDAEGALAAWREAVAAWRRVLTADPPSRLSRHHSRLDELATLNRIAGLLRRRGEREEALALYRERVEITRRVATADPYFWPGHLATALLDYGDALREQGDPGSALTAYRESLEIRGQLAEEDPSSVEDQHRLEEIRQRIGDTPAAEAPPGADDSYRGDE